MVWDRAKVRAMVGVRVRPRVRFRSEITNCACAILKLRSAVCKVRKLTNRA